MRSDFSVDTRRRIQNHIALLGSLDDAESQRAERRLIRFGHKAVEPLLTAAFSTDPQVRFRAVWILGKSRDARALAVIAALTKDPDARVRYDAVLALGELGCADAVPLLRQIARRDDDPAQVASAAVSALIKLGAV